MKDQEAVTVAEALEYGWLHRHGYPFNALINYTDQDRMGLHNQKAITEYIAPIGNKSSFLELHLHK